MCQACIAQRQCTAALHGKRVPCHVLSANQAQFKIIDKLSPIYHMLVRVGLQAHTKVKSSKRVSNMGHVCSEACISSNDCTQALPKYAVCEAQTKQQQSAHTAAGGSARKTLQDVKYTKLKNENKKLESLSKLMSRGTLCVQLLTVEHATRNSCNIEPLASWHGEHEIADTACFGQFCSFFAFYCSFESFRLILCFSKFFMMAGTSELTGPVWVDHGPKPFPRALESPRIHFSVQRRGGSPKDHLKPRKAPVTTKTAEIDAFLKDSFLLFRAWQAFCANGVFGLPPEVGSPKLPKDPVVVLNLKRSPPDEFSHAEASALASVVMRDLQSGRTCGKPNVFRHDMSPSQHFLPLSHSLLSESSILCSQTLQFQLR